MNKIKLDYSGGFPLTQDTLNFLQIAYNDSLKGVCSLLGNRVILSGCTNTGGIISPGYVVLDGEVLPCIGGSGDSVFVQQSEKAVLFRDGVRNPVFFTRTLEFGTGADPMYWEGFVRLADMQTLTAHLANKENPHGVTKAQVGLGNIPNAISDATNLNSSDTLATSRAVKTLADRLPLHRGSQNVGDLAERNTFTVTFPSVGISNYMVMGSWQSVSNNGNYDAHMLGWVWGSATTTSFKVDVLEFGSVLQNVTFNYLLFRR